MRNILVIGNLGYVGQNLTAHLKAVYRNDITIVGYDLNLFNSPADQNVKMQIFGDVRRFNYDCLAGMDAVVYLAAISNDPMGKAWERPTMAINFHAAFDIAIAAERYGVKHFVFPSSCAVYGFAGDTPKTEHSDVNPLTAYAHSKVLAEEALKVVARGKMMVTCLRFATACGYSPSMRLDLVLNDFVANAMIRKEISIQSNGEPWRPMIHVDDMARAIDWACQRDGDQYLMVNAGHMVNNFQVSGLAHMVKMQILDTKIWINTEAVPDKRTYRVNFSFYHSIVHPRFAPSVTVAVAIRQMINLLSRAGLNAESIDHPDYYRLRTLQGMIDAGKLDNDLNKIYSQKMTIPNEY